MVHNELMIGREVISRDEFLELMSPSLFTDSGVSRQVASGQLRAPQQDARCPRFQSPPSLHELASLVGTNECTLKSAFKQEFGMTVYQYLFEYRMELAVHYLLDTGQPVTTIGMALGYDYQSHFCTVFHRKFGVSPSEFRLRRGMV